MKIKERTLTEAASEDNDYRDAIEIFDGETEIFSAHDGECEDNTLGRNFSDCWNVVGLMKAAYDAGVAGEGFTVEHEQVDEM
jgi:hypothetical protein